MNKTITAVALCAVGAEKALSNELRKLTTFGGGADKVSLDKEKQQGNINIEESAYGRVRFKTDITGLYKSLIGLRTADRVLLEIANFKATDFDALFDGAAAAAWENLVANGMGLKVAKVRTNRSQLKAETSIQAIVHKAAAQRLCEKYKVSRLPEPVMSARGQNEPVKVAEVRVYIEKDIVSLLVDCSGEPLFKRGYRSEGGAAPLRETTAASLILLSGWKRKFPFYDPFCGSGTFLIEAAMYAWDIAPGLGRRFFLEDLLIADSKIEETVREEFRAKIDFSRLVRIAGSDEDQRSVSIAASNIARLHDIAEGRAPVRGIRPAESNLGIELKALPMLKAAAPFTDAGFLMTNPPYGKRLGDQVMAEQIYTQMADLQQRFPGWKFAIITDHSGFESFFGKKADSCREISNGAIPSFFFQYGL